MQNLRSGALGAALFLVAMAAAKPSDDPVAKIVDEGKNRNQVMNILAQLARGIGPRLTGSTNLDKAQQWAMGQFKSFGLTNVHREKWGDVPVGFERGSRQIGKIVAPFEWNVEFTTMNWTEGTNGAVRGPAIPAPATVEEFEANKASYKGAWILMPEVTTMRGPVAPPRTGGTPAQQLVAKLRGLLDEAGIAGRIYGAADERVHSSGNWRDKTFEARPKGVEVTVRKSDYQRLKRVFELGQKPEVEFDIENKWIKGPIPQYNVIADIKGTEKPDEYVIVCGHLDSWNSPGSQGACDNGTGSAVALEAARILGTSKVKPKRTIRFILWSGEEQGLLGSRGYVETHKAELGKISAVLNDDGGSGYQGGYQGIESMKSIMEAAFAPTNAAFPDMQVKFDSRPQMPSGGSSDHAPFIWAGVPAFFTMETGAKANYGKVWHTQYDRWEEAVPEYLVQSSTNHAVVAFNLANAPTLLPRFTPPVRNAMTLQQAVGADHVYEDPNQVARLKQLGLHDHDDDYVLHVWDYAFRAIRYLWLNKP